MEKPSPPPPPSPVDVCAKCRRPIDVVKTVWISVAGVLFGAWCGSCR